MCRIVCVLVGAVANATQLLAEKYCLELHSPDTPVSVVEFVDLSAALSRHLSAICCLYFLQSRCVRRLALIVAINEFARLGLQLRVRANKLFEIRCADLQA